MRKKYILLLSVCFNLFAFEFEGDPRMWSREDLVDFDEVGDCLSNTGDISSVFTLIEDGKLFLRITFDDMYSRKDGVDYFEGQDIKVWQTQIIKNNIQNVEPGKVMSIKKDGIIIKTGCNTIKLIQIEPNINVIKGAYL